ncbi:hypothetical protein [Leucobacter luti]|uniref:Uncharacterized protein n=1 Tax=Leucobacter luti TaxID=340320 RepID=A0A4Q7U5S1_9MICO|nr:hypothetical protein [Leucobacter luti]MBL3700682.1 hypothetical protein [Leucobacter luti]RZT68477.1 hypothetical protein EV139_0202 [Leucobacter luti]
MTNQASGPTAEQAAPAHESHATQHAPFVPTPNPPISASTIIGFIISAVLVFGGFYLMGLAFSVPGAEIWLFAGGLGVDALGLWIAFGIIPALTDRE